MAKKDVHEAIDATMVPNGVKAINADSVRNLLHMMTDNAGEGGGGDGGVKVYALMPDVIRDMTGEANLEFTPESWAEIKAMVEEVNPGFIPPEFDAAMEEAFAANAEVYKTMMQKATEGVSTFGFVDMGKLLKAALALEDPGLADAINYSAAFVASVVAFDFGVLEKVVTFIPLGVEGMGMGKGLGLTLLPDGGYAWEDMSVDSASYTLNVLAEGVTLPDSYRYENIQIIDAGFGATGADFHIWNINSADSDGTVSESSGGRFLIHEVIQFEGFLYFDGLELKKCTIDSEGNATIAVVGSLNAPTA
jgi:hypothetical protein